MRVVLFWTILFWMNVCTLTISNHTMMENNTTQIEDRLGLKARIGSGFTRIQSSTYYQDPAMPRFVHSIGTSIGGIATTIKNSNKLTTGQKIRQIGDAIVPVIMWGLALGGPWANLIGGVVAGMWSALSPFLGKSQMEQAIDDIHKELDEIRKEVDELAIKITDAVEEETRAKLQSIVNRGIQGEISRNQYICSKYALVSQTFIEDVKQSKPLNETLRFEIILHLNDCDNFLKDTAGAYIYNNYADVLWVPAVVTTMARVMFLTEVVNYGMHLKIDEEILYKQWTEIKWDLKQLFEFAGTAVVKRMESLIGNSRRSHSLRFTSNEYEICKVQAHLLYLDRELYTYGTPKFFELANDSQELKIEDYNVTKDDKKPHHIQIFYNRQGKFVHKSHAAILNCINGKSPINRITLGNQMSFGITYVLEKSYYIRVVYFIKKRFFSAKSKEVEENILEEDSVDRIAIADVVNDTITIDITRGEPNKTNERFATKAGLHALNCPNNVGIQNNIRYETPTKGDCVSNQTGYTGVYIMENVFAFDAPSDMNPNGKITIQVLGDAQTSTIILGAELIILPIVKDQ